MSGIVGVVRRDGTDVDRRAVREMVEALDHRGPDGRDVVVDGPVGFGHCLLSTTPEDGRVGLPLASGDLLVTADARIDNRPELRSALADDLTGSPTDAELIRAAYHEWGTDCPEYLVGAYAFAVWDRANRRTVCARDHMGIRPLYYHRSPDVFAFASEIEPLFALPSVSGTVDERRLAQYLGSVFPGGERTFFSDVDRLPAAQWLSVGPGGLDGGEYWTLDPSRRIDLPSEEAYAAAFREVFEEAVRCRLRCDGGVASMLSGGIDSSSIVCTADALSDASPSLSTYSVVFGDVPAADERAYAEAVVDTTDVDPTFVRGDRLDPLASVDDVIDGYDQPFLAPNHFLHWELYRRASADGNRVVLDGTDGDRVLSHGEGHLADLAVGLRPLAFLSELRGLKRNFGGTYRRILLQDVGVPLAPDPVKDLWYAVTDADRSPRVDDVVDDEYADRVGPLDDGEDDPVPVANAGSHARAIHHARLDSIALTSTLELCDASAAAHGIAPRYPFFDRRLMEFCLALPADQKIDAGLTRTVLRRALADVLPDAVRERPDKSNLGPNFDGTLRRFGRERIAAVPESLSTVRPYVDEARVAAARDAFLSTDRGERRSTGIGADPAIVVWKAIVAERWSRNGKTQEWTGRTTATERTTGELDPRRSTSQ